MQKEELLHLHLLMVQIKKYYESVSGNTVSTTDYDALQISPIHIHKNKNLHRVALLTLGNEIVAEMKASGNLPAHTAAADSQMDNESATTFARDSGTGAVAEH